MTSFLAKFATQGEETTSLQTRDCGVHLDVIDVTAGRQKTKQKASIELERRDYVLILDRGYVTLQHDGDPHRKAMIWRNPGVYEWETARSTTSILNLSA